MTPAGIVRRIDELGRIVIPKEIRRILRIREGDPLEIFTSREGEVLLRKYSPMGEMADFAVRYAESLAQTTGHLVFITDKDHFIAAAGAGRKDFLQKHISPQLEAAIDERDNMVAKRDEKGFVKITSEENELKSQAISTIISEGDAIGAVIITTKDEKSQFGDTEKKLASTAAGFLSRM